MSSPENTEQGLPLSWSTLRESLNPYLLRVIRRRLSRELRRSYDSEDFQQAVWASVLRAGHQIEDFSSVSAIRRLVSRIAANKVISQHRRRDVACRHGEQLQARYEQQRVCSPSPSPSQTLIGAEARERLTHHSDPVIASLLGMRAEEVSPKEICARLNISERQLYRILEQVRGRLEQEQL